MSKLIHLKYHWEDINGDVPTDENDWWEYHSINIEDNRDPEEAVIAWAMMEMRHYSVMQCNRKIFAYLIDRPPQKHIDEQIRQCNNLLNKTQQELDFWNTI